MKKYILTVFSLLLTILLIGIFFFNKAQTNLKNTNSAPITNTALELKNITINDKNLKIKDKDNNAINLNTFINKPSLLFYWASWCPDCQKQIPEIQKSYEKYKDKINFLMVNYNDEERETKEIAVKYVNDKKYTMPLYFYEATSMAKMKLQTIPTIYFIDKEGFIREVSVDFKNSEEINTILDSLLN